MVHGKEDVTPAACCKGLESGGGIACGGAAHYKRERLGPRSRHAVSVQSEWRARWRKRVPCTMRVCVCRREGRVLSFTTVSHYREREA